MEQKGAGGRGPTKAKPNGNTSRILVNAGWEPNRKETEAQKG